MARNDIYQLKVTLKRSKPPIWRRIQLRGDTRLDKLHDILQATMDGWLDYHLHQYVVGETYYGTPNPDYDMWGMDMRDETKYRLNQLAPREKSRLVYEYDFGDNWEHVLLVEKILPPEKGVNYPRCIKGKRACPPEDVGGIWGYEDFMLTITDPAHPEHNQMREWVGNDFDPVAFDLEGINGELATFLAGLILGIEFPELKNNN